MLVEDAVDVQYYTIGYNFDKFCNFNCFDLFVYFKACFTVDFKQYSITQYCLCFLGSTDQFALSEVSSATHSRSINHS